MSDGDRDRPGLLRRHPWLLIIGGMLLIGAMDLILGLALWPEPKPDNEPLPSFMPPAEADAGPGLDAGAAEAPAPDLTPR